MNLTDGGPDGVTKDLPRRCADVKDHTAFDRSAKCRLDISTQIAAEPSNVDQVCERRVERLMRLFFHNETGS